MTYFFNKNKKTVKKVPFGGPWGIGGEKFAGDLGERVPRVPRGMPNSGLPDSAGPGQYTAAAQRVGVKKGHLLHVVMAFGYAST